MQQPSHNQPHHTQSKDSNEKKIENVLGKGQFGFRRGKELGMLRIISEPALDIGEELCACI